MSDNQPPPPDYNIIPHDPAPLAEPASQPPAQRRGRGCFYATIGSLGCVILILIIPLTLLILGVTSTSSLISSLGGVLGVGQPPKASVISSQTIVEGIQPLGQLVSISVQLAKADIRVNINQGTADACGYGASHVAQGTVQAGIDLTKIKPGDLTYDSARQTYVLTLPQPQLTSCSVDYIRQYDQSFTTCSVDWDEARLLASYMALTSFRDDAVEGGILSRAQTQTQVVLGNFVRLLTGHPIEIDFAGPAATEVPASCSPDVPAGWSYSAANGVWTK